METGIELPENSALPIERERSATHLLKAIIIKAGLEIFVICAAVSLAAYSHISPPLRGAIDVAESTRIAGWAFDPDEPNSRLEVQLFIDGQFVASKIANEKREDLVKRGAANDAQHGFNFSFQPKQISSGKHNVQVFAVHSGAGVHKSLLSITRTPLTFEVR